MYTGSEKLLSANITDIMQTAYIDYSMSVIIARALPDARDGLKPVQRRILYAMLREGLLHNRSHTKCAGVVGEVLKNYHPHGDASVYDTLVRLAQTWVMRYPLIDPQGNFGSVDGDPPAAYRYTECRLNQAAEATLKQNIVGHEARIRTLGERDATFSVELKAAQADAAAARAPVPEPALEAYDRAAGRGMPAVVAIRGGKCGGCHLKVSSEVESAARGKSTDTEFALCDQCGKMVYWES